MNSMTSLSKIHAGAILQPRPAAFCVNFAAPGVAPRPKTRRRIHSVMTSPSRCASGRFLLVVGPHFLEVGVDHVVLRRGMTFVRRGLGPGFVHSFAELH